MVFKVDTTYGDVSTSTSNESITLDHTSIRKTLGGGGYVQYEVEAKTADICLNILGVAADTTLTAGKLAAGNIRVAAGSIRIIEIPITVLTLNYKTFSGTGEFWATAGYGERT
jgi:hypothetical protein